MNLKTEIRSMPKASQISLVAQWASRIREANSKDLEILFALDDLFSETYEKLRIKKGFQAASLTAFETVFSVFLLDDEKPDTFV